MSRRSDFPDEIDWERVARAETHPLRMSILELLAMDGRRTLSPKEMSCELQESLGTVIYHTTELRKSGLVTLIHEHEVGGTVEHFYCLPGHSGADLFERLRLWRAPRGRNS